MMMKRRRHWGAAVGTVLASVVTATPVGAQATDLAPTGRLRVAVALGNTALVTKDPATGALRGIWIDLSRALAARLGVPVAFVEYATGAEANAATGAWDLTSTSAPDQAAAMGDAVAIPYLDADNTLLVGPTSAIRSTADMDRPGVRIATASVGGPAQDLTGLLRRAEVVSVLPLASAVPLLQAGEVDALAAGRGNLLMLAPQVPGARLLADRFSVQQQRIALAPGRSAASLALASDVTRQALATGLIRASIQRNGVSGVQPSPLPAALPRTGRPERPSRPPAVFLSAGLVVTAAALLACGRRLRPVPWCPTCNGYDRSK
jgi:polar amino acid transport system substrate-binding protein